MIHAELIDRMKSTGDTHPGADENILTAVSGRRSVVVFLREWDSPARDDADDENFSLARPMTDDRRPAVCYEAPVLRPRSPVYFQRSETVPPGTIAIMKI